MTTCLFIIGLASIVAGVAMLSIPAAAIVAGAPLIVGAVLIERGRAALHPTTEPEPDPLYDRRP